VNVRSHQRKKKKTRTCNRIGSAIGFFFPSLSFFGVFCFLLFFSFSFLFSILFLFTTGKKPAFFAFCKRCLYSMFSLFSSHNYYASIEMDSREPNVKLEFTHATEETEADGEVAFGDADVDMLDAVPEAATAAPAPTDDAAAGDDAATASASASSPPERRKRGRGRLATRAENETDAQFQARLAKNRIANERRKQKQLEKKRHDEELRARAQLEPITSSAQATDGDDEHHRDETGEVSNDVAAAATTKTAEAADDDDDDDVNDDDDANRARRKCVRRATTDDAASSASSGSSASGAAAAAASRVESRTAKRPREYAYILSLDAASLQPTRTYTSLTDVQLEAHRDVRLIESTIRKVLNDFNCTAFGYVWCDVPTFVKRFI
jgi:hypothetical protein